MPSLFVEVDGPPTVQAIMKMFMPIVNLCLPNANLLMLCPSAQINNIMDMERLFMWMEQ
jgi:hypothetical protein